jgi:rhamnulokinase
MHLHLEKSRDYLCVDIGAESGRIMAGTWDGKKLGLGEIHRFSNAPVSMGGTLRWDLVGLWKGVVEGLRRAHAQRGEAICSVGVDTWALDYVLQDARGEWLGLPYCYRDARTSGLVEELCRRIPRAEIFAETGLQFMEINTLCQLWAMQRGNPALLETARKFLMIPDWIHAALSGVEACEFTNATTTQFLNPLTRRWSESLLQRLEIPTHFLPDLIGPGTLLGPLRAPVASETGLSNVNVIAPATHDTASAVVAVPTRHTGKSNWAYLSSGTWSLLGVEIPQAQLSETVLRLNFTNEGGVDGTYRLLRNIMGMWLLQGLRRAFQQRNGDRDYASMVQLAAEAPPLRSLVDPDAPEFLRAPDMVDAIQTACQLRGEPIPDTEGQLVRCVLESLALRYRQVVEWLEEITGTPIEVVHIVGGGSRNALLNQFTANACNRPVIAGPVETTALGNLLWQARTDGEMGSLAEARDVVRSAFAGDIREFTPQRENLAQWEAAHARWRARVV